MDLDAAANYWKGRLLSGKSLYRVRVRRLLEIAGAERRGWVITNRIREVLERHGLETYPDFQTAWMDGFVRIQPKGTVNEMSGEGPGPLTYQILLSSLSN